jgi:hypothetical protein
MFSKAKADAYQRIEAILEKGPFVVGTHAVHRAFFLYELRWSQAGARIHEMNSLGWRITSITLPENDWQDGIRTAYRLDSKPLQSQEPKPESDFMCRRREEREEAAPLFAEVRP